MTREQIQKLMLKFKKKIKKIKSGKSGLSQLQFDNWGYYGGGYV